jgi:hypothetical protein
MQNPLETYRRLQRALRREFDSFTTIYCPVCPTPCCVSPARIAPTDILLAEGVGWKPRIPALEGGKDAVLRAAEQMTEAMFEGVSDEEAPAPCEHLGEQGCTFPADLRPFGCTTYLCPYMYQHLDRHALARLRRMIRELERAHAVLMEHLHRKQPDRLRIISRDRSS